MPRFTEQEIRDARYQLSNEEQGRKGLYPLIKTHGKEILKIEKMIDRDLEDRDDLELDLENLNREQRKNKHLTYEEIRKKIQSFNHILEKHRNKIKAHEKVIESFYKKLPEFEKKLDRNTLDELMIKFKLIYTPDSYGSRPIYEELYKYKNPSFEIYFDEEEGQEPTEDEVERMTPISRSEYELNAMSGQIGNRDDYNYVDYRGGAKKSRKKRKSRKARKSKKVKKTHKSKKMRKTKKGQRGQRGQKRKTRKQK